MVSVERRAPVSSSPWVRYLIFCGPVADDAADGASVVLASRCMMARCLAGVVSKRQARAFSCT